MIIENIEFIVVNTIKDTVLLSATHRYGRPQITTGERLIHRVVVIMEASVK